LQHLFELRANRLKGLKDELDLVLREAEDYEHALNRHFYYRFSNESSSKEHAERDQEVPAEEACKIKERIWNLKSKVRKGKYSY
jgi:hypothetical protein